MKRALFTPLLAIAIAAAAPCAFANSDEVQFGSDINITPGQPAHDVVCFFCDVRAEGTVNGDIVVFFGKISLNGEAHHDVVNFFGKITAADNSDIGGDMVSFFGPVELGQNVTVRKDLVAFFGTLRAPDSVSIGGSRVSMPAWVVSLPPLMLLLVIFLIIREYRSYRRRQLLYHYGYLPHP